MRIGIVLPSIPAYSETFFTNKIKGLEAKGHTVLLFVNNSNNQENISLEIKKAPVLEGNTIQVSMVSFYLLVLSLLFHFKTSKRLYKLDRKDGIGFFQCIKNIVSNHHIISESLDWLHFGFGTMVFNRENVARAIGAKMAISFRGFDIGIYPLKNPDCYQKLWDKVDKIHVISNDIKDLVFKNGFMGNKEIIKITPAIDTSFFANDKECNFSKENKLITIARLHWKKGLVYTLEALALLKKQGIPFHYTIIGEGVELERLKFAAYQLGLQKQVTFTGKIPHKTVKEKLNQADVYLQYSIQEGFCNAVLEAQAMGLLCIVSDAEGLPENIKDKETGWIVPRCDSRELANKITEVINLSASEKKQISLQAQKRVNEHFTIEQQQLKFVNFYTN